MDIAPNQVIRLLQTGQIDRAVQSTAIWKCVSCFTCSSRCPQQVDCAGVMDALRQIAAERNIHAGAEARTYIFYQAFLTSVRRHGRLNELELTGLFKARSALADVDIPFMFKDAALAPALYQRKKLHLGFKSVRDRDVVRRIFAKCGA